MARQNRRRNKNRRMQGGIKQMKFDDIVLGVMLICFAITFTLYTIAFTKRMNDTEEILEDRLNPSFSPNVVLSRCIESTWKISCRIDSHCWAYEWQNLYGDCQIVSEEQGDCANNAFRECSQAVYGSELFNNQ